MHGFLLIRLALEAEKEKQLVFQAARKHRQVDVEKKVVEYEERRIEK